MRRLIGSALAALAVCGTALALAMPALASGSVPPGTVTACVTRSRTFAHVYTNTPTKPSCTNGSWRANIASEEQLQATNGQVGTNATDIAALKGQEVTGGTTDLGGAASVATGGPFATNATQVGSTVSLKAGTYVLSLSAKATPPSGGTGTVQVFPEFFVYSQPKNPAFTGDLFNVGSGPLESGTNANIDSYYSGSTVLTLSSDTKLYVYAFGYDSDRGSGSYILDDLSVSATRINPARL